MKKLITSFILLFAILGVFGLTAYAAPDTLYPDAAGNAAGLVTIANPELSSDMTFDNSYVVSGYGEVGTVVTMYTYNPENGLYEKLYKTVTTVSESGAYETEQKSVTSTIGESTLFINTVSLNSGSNSFMLYAEKEGRVQISKFFIIKHNYNVVDVLRTWGIF